MGLRIGAVKGESPGTNDGELTILIGDQPSSFFFFLLAMFERNSRKAASLHGAQVDRQYGRLHSRRRQAHPAYLGSLSPVRRACPASNSGTCGARIGEAPPPVSMARGGA